MAKNITMRFLTQKEVNALETAVYTPPRKWLEDSKKAKQEKPKKGGDK